MKNKRYYVNYYCTNCHERFNEYFDFGTPAKQGACPFCGVTESQKERAEWEELVMKASSNNF